MESDLKKVTATTPVIVFAHDPIAGDARHFINPNGNNDINDKDQFENLLVDKFADGTTTADASGNLLPAVAEQRALAAFLKQHPNIVAYFHGHDHNPRFYTFNGPDKDIALQTFAADSPMKGVVSSKDETKLLYHVISIDTVTMRMTVREYLWNAKAWGMATTVSLVPKP
jgi:hypothetical protein